MSNTWFVTGTSRGLGQLGDPTKVAAAIVSVALDQDAPLHQVLGSDSLGLARAGVEALGSDIEAGRELALTTDVSAS